jgi:HrpA-like RNA helicase
MLLAAERLACLPEMLIIVSGLSIQDPREQPRVAVVTPPQGPAMSRSSWSRPTVTRSRVSRSGSMIGTV